MRQPVKEYPDCPCPFHHSRRPSAGRLQRGQGKMAADIRHPGPDTDLEGEATAPPEAQQEEVVIDGKTMVRSRNPYYLTMPNEPEYVYTEKGKELKTLQGMIEKSIARRMGLSTTTEASKGVPEAKVKEMARQEVDRILREQGLKGFYPPGKLPSGVMGRFVAVYPNPANARSMEGPNYTLSTTLADYLAKQKDVQDRGPGQGKEYYRQGWGHWRYKSASESPGPG